MSNSPCTVTQVFSLAPWRIVCILSICMISPSQIISNFQYLSSTWSKSKFSFLDSGTLNSYISATRDAFDAFQFCLIGRARTSGRVFCTVLSSPSKRSSIRHTQSILQIWMFNCEMRPRRIACERPLNSLIPVSLALCWPENPS